LKVKVVNRMIQKRNFYRILNHFNNTKVRMLSNYNEPLGEGCGWEELSTAVATVVASVWAGCEVAVGVGVVEGGGRGGWVDGGRLPGWGVFDCCGGCGEGCCCTATGCTVTTLGDGAAVTVVAGPAEITWAAGTGALAVITTICGCWCGCGTIPGGGAFICCTNTDCCGGGW
jgi:hypothetical protein